jgi:hypothetical protein
MISPSSGLLRSILLASWWLAPFVAAVAQTPAERFDILGFRLGMTAEEVEANFRRLNPALEPDRHYVYFKYSDGVEEFQTEPFLDRITGLVRHDTTTQTTLYIQATFSQPPAGGRVIQVTRTDSNLTDPVTSAEYRQALVDRYGAPSSERPGRLQWHFPEGRVACATSASGPLVGQLATLVQGRDREQKLANPGQCASYLSFQMRGDPVRDGNARLVDVEQGIRSLIASGAWVAELQAQATERRKARGRGPEL